VLEGLLSLAEELLDRMTGNASELVAQRLNHHDLPRVIGGRHATNFCLMGSFIKPTTYLVSYRETITQNSEMRQIWVDASNVLASELEVRSVVKKKRERGEIIGDADTPGGIGAEYI
jgi:hypothetical protein